MTDKTGAASYAGAGIAAAVGTVTVQEWAAAIGLLMGAATFAVNWYYKRQDSIACRAADEAKLKHYSGDNTDDTTPPE